MPRKKTPRTRTPRQRRARRKAGRKAARTKRKRRLRTPAAKRSFPRKRVQVIQSIAFHRDWWTQKQAEAWLRRKKYKWSVGEETVNFLHYRLRPKTDFWRASFRVITDGPGINITLGKLRGPKGRETYRAK